MTNQQRAEANEKFRAEQYKEFTEWQRGGEAVREALQAVAELRLFEVRKDDHELSIRLDRIEEVLKGKWAK